MLTIIETLAELRQSSEPIIYFSRYRADQVDNGGARRSAQLRQLLAGYDVAVVSSLTKQLEAGSKHAARSGSLLFERAVRAVVRCWTRKYGGEFGRGLFFSERLAKRWVKALQLRQKPRLVLMDDPIFFPSLLRYCTDRNIPVIAHCHNIETLSREQVMPRYQQELLAYELGLLAQCRASVTISAEEAFLLRNLGMTAQFIPYRPPNDIEVQLLAVRQQREISVKRGFILLGSAGNAPTREGMKQLLSVWRDIGGIPGEQLYVAGYGTEVLRDVADLAGVTFCGAITSEQLAEHLCNVRAGLVYQENGAGALTRIGEYLLAGVPVVANSHALRSYRNIPGVLEFADLHDLRSILEIFLTGVSTVPLPPKVDTAPFLRLVDESLQNH